MLYVLKAQGINGDIIRTFINYVESNTLKLIKTFDDIKDNLPKDLKEDDLLNYELACTQVQLLIDEVANLKLKKTQTAVTVEPVIKRLDKDRYSATVYALYYIAMFLEHEEDTSDYDFVFSYS